MEQIYELINLPVETKVNKLVDKEKFINNGNIDDELKEIFTKYVENINWKYSLKGNMLNIPTYNSVNMQYSEVEVFEVTINNNLCIYDVALALGRCIQYPVIIFIKKDNKFKIGTYYVRENKKDYTKNVVQDIVYTGWFDYSNYTGRIVDILKEINFNNIPKNNVYEFYKYIHTKIIKYHSSYLLNSNVKELFNNYNLNEDRYNFNDLKNKCEIIKIDENTLNKFDWMKRNKLEKYNKSYANSNLMICKDEIFNYISNNYLGKGFKDYKDFIRQIESTKKRENAKESKKSEAYVCFWQVNGMCSNYKSSKYGKICRKYSDCHLFTKKRLEKITIDKIPSYDLKSSICNNEELNKKYDNKIENLVEYGDTINIVDNNEVSKRFMIIKNINDILPEIPKLCLGKKIDEIILYKGKEYKIISIEKNQNKIENSQKVKKEEIANESSFVEINDKVEVTMKYTYGKDKKENCTKVTFTIRDDVISKNSYMHQICLNKEIGFRFKIGKKDCEIVNIYKGRK